MARKRRDLAPEERDLWRRVQTTVRPMHAKPPPIGMDDVLGDRGLDAASSPARDEPFMAPQTPRGRAAPNVDIGADRRGPNPPAPASFAIDPTNLRNLRRGRRSVDGKIDLHGLYQDQAFAALELFLESRRAAGARAVLVVTGKGVRRKAGRAFFDKDEISHDRSAPGVLRRSAPGWFTGPLARHVAGFAAAGPRHGGDGAFYVVLRKPDGA